jgi:DNA-cytosine methyltransferase
MRVLSLFDGISCGRIALERANITVEKYYASEIDKYAIQISKKNYPDIIHIGDITKLDFNEYKDVDLIIGGSPCQDLSIAKNNRQGLNGSKSSLFYKFVEAIETIKPKYFLLENVASMSKENKDIISKILGVEPILINSSLVSAQQRKRLYWCNWKVEQPLDKGIYLKDILENGVAINAINDKAITIKSQYAKNGKANFINGGTRSATCVINQFIGNLYNKRIFSDKSGTLGTCNGRTAKQGIGVYQENFDYFIRKLTPIECERLQTLPNDYTAGISNTQRYKCIGNGWTIDIVSWIFSFINIDNE